MINRHNRAYVTVGPADAISCRSPVLAVGDLRSAVRLAAGEAQHRRRKRAQAVQARHADRAREEGAAEGEGRGGVGDILKGGNVG